MESAYTKDVKLKCEEKKKESVEEMRDDGLQMRCSFYESSEWK